MARFTDMIDSLGMGEDGLTAYPDTFTADLTAAYDEDMSIPAARVEVLEADLLAAKAEILSLKAHNYELITQVPVESETPEPTDDNADDDDETDKGVDSLFGDDKKDKE